MIACGTSRLLGDQRGEAVNPVGIPILIGVLLMCLDCVPILAAEIPAPGANVAVPVSLIVVDTVDDAISADGKCSLREAVLAANADAPVDACPAGIGDDTIILPAGRYNLRLIGASEDANLTGDLDLLSNITLVGAGADATIIDGGGNDRVLDIHAGARVVVSGVMITNGTTPDGKDDPEAGGGDAEPGGGIRNAGDLWLVLSHVTENRTGYGGSGAIWFAEPWGGAGGDGGGIYNRGALTLQSSEVAHNLAGGGGASLLVGPCIVLGRSGDGGGVWNDGTLISINSTITGNRAKSDSWGDDNGGGAWNSGTLVVTHSLISANVGTGISNHRILTITHSTISANVGYKGGGGIANRGHLTLSYSTLSANHAGDGISAPIYKCTSGPGSGGNGGAIINSGWLSVSNCTLSGNRAGDGGTDPWYPDEIAPGGSGGGIFNSGIIQLEYSTITANATGRSGSGYQGSDPGGDGGGIANQAGGQITAKGFLLADNTAARDGMDCLGILTSQGNNLIHDPDACALSGNLTDDIIGQDAQLELLADNGGGTWTHALRNDSPAIDRGNCLGLNGAPLTTDQRGEFRPQGRACDIGAYERKSSIYLPLIVK